MQQRSAMRRLLTVVMESLTLPISGATIFRNYITLLEVKDPGSLFCINN